MATLIAFTFNKSEPAIRQTDVYSATPRTETESVSPYAPAPLICSPLAQALAMERSVAAKARSDGRKYRSKMLTELIISSDHDEILCIERGN